MAAGLLRVNVARSVSYFPIPFAVDTLPAPETLDFLSNAGTASPLLAGRSHSE